MWGMAADVCFHCLISSAEMSSRLSCSSLALSSALASLRNSTLQEFVFATSLPQPLIRTPVSQPFMTDSSYLFPQPPHPTPPKRTNLNYVIGLVLQVLLLLSHLIGSLILFGRLNFGHIYSFVTIRELTLLGLQTYVTCCIPGNFQETSNCYYIDL